MICCSFSMPRQHVELNYAHFINYGLFCRCFLAGRAWFLPSMDIWLIRRYDDTAEQLQQEMKPPVARLRGQVQGFCFSPCEIDTGTEIRFTALLSGAYGEDNNIIEYS